MIEYEGYWADILTQMSVIKSAMNNVSLHLLEKHARHCVSDAIADGNGDEAIEELMDIFKRFTKS